MNIEIQNSITAIKNKLSKLVDDKIILQKENEKLKLQLENTNVQINSQKEVIQSLKMQLQALQLMQNNMNDADKKELQKTIEQYISVINNTITLLS